MMAPTIKLRATGPLLFGGTMRVRGGILYVDPVTARELIASGRAKLDDPNDIVLLLDEPAGLPAPCPTMARPLRWLTR